MSANRVHVNISYSCVFQSLRLEDGIQLRMNELLQSLALEHRDLRLQAKAIYRNRHNMFKSLVVRELSREMYSKASKRIMTAKNVNHTIAVKYSEEQLVYAEACLLLYEVRLHSE